MTESESSIRKKRATIPEESRRKPCFGKVSPDTRDYLDSMAESNDGRRIDKLVTFIRGVERRLKSAAGLPVR